MTNVRIVFSDGSRELAHNLDDLRQRWILSKQKEYQQTRVHYELPREIDFTQPETFEQAVLWTEELKGICASLERELTELRLSNLSRFTVDVKLKKASIVAELKYRQCAIRYLKIFISAHEKQQMQDVPAYIAELKHKLAERDKLIKTLRGCIKELEHQNNLLKTTRAEAIHAND